MSFPVHRFCAEPLALAQDLRTRRSIFTASIPRLHAQTTDILHQLIDGNFDDFRNNTSAIIIGSRLAELLQTSVGETVQLLAPNGEYLAIQRCSDRTCRDWLDRFDSYLLARQGCTGVAAAAFRSFHDHL